jgi:hypothetical protein
MNDKNTQIALLAVVHQVYPGGVKDFFADGGAIDYVPTDPIKILLTCEHGLKELSEKVQSMFTGSIKVVPVNSEELNFVSDNIPPEEAHNNIGRALGEALEEMGIDSQSESVMAMYISLSTLAVQICVGEEFSKEQIDILAKHLSNVAGMKRFYINTKEGQCIEVTGAFTDKKEPEVSTSKVSLENIRETVIKDDDELNVKILLESSNTVEDFLKSIGG